MFADSFPNFKTQQTDPDPNFEKVNRKTQFHLKQRQD